MDEGGFTMRADGTPIWSRLQEHWSALCPELPQGGLNAPATGRQLAAVEALTGVPLPDDLREAYLHFNGMQREAVWSSKTRVPRVILGEFQWLDLESLADAWVGDRCREAWADAEPDLHGPEEAEGQAVRPCQHHRAWLPLGHSGTSVHCNVDMAPGPAGEVGQLLHCDFEFGTPTLLAPSFVDCISAMLDALDREAVVWDGWSFVSRADKAPLSSLDAWLRA
jgi:cell wall assembly regulator SMI1